MVTTEITDIISTQTQHTFTPKKSNENKLHFAQFSYMLNVKKSQSQ